MKKELESTALGSVAGGRIVETKDGGWLVVPEFCKTFDTKEEAEKWDSEIKTKRGPEMQGPRGPHDHHGHHGHHGPHGPHEPQGFPGGHEPKND